MRAYEHYREQKLSHHIDQEIDLYIYNGEKINLDVSNEDFGEVSVKLNIKETQDLIEYLQEGIRRIQKNALYQIGDNYEQ